MRRHSLHPRHGLAKQDFIEQVGEWPGRVQKSLEPFTLEYAEQRCGIPIETLKQIAHMIADADGVCILWAMGVTQHCVGSDTSTAISNLLLVTGNYMRPGTGAYPLRGHNNVQGASDHGAMPNYFPGYQKVEDPEIRAKFEKAWGVTLPPKPGLDNHQMIDAIHDGTLKAMYLFGEEMSLVDSNANYVDADALEKLDFFVVQDIFFSETCRFADVDSAGEPISLEKEGTFTNTERRIQRLYQVFEPLGESRPDWRIIQDVANRLGAHWNYQHPAEIYTEIAALTPLMAGVTYERLEGYKTLQWPVAVDGSDQPLLYTKEFHFPDGKANLFPVSWNEPTDQPDELYDLHLNNGRLLEHFHEGNMTYRSQGIKAKTPDTFVEVSPELALERGIHSGTWVQAYLALRQSTRSRRGDRPRTRQGTLHAHELGGEPGQSPHQQSHGCGDPHSGLQGNIRADDRAARAGREPAASNQLPVWSSHAAAWRRSGAQMEASRLYRTRKPEVSTDQD